MNKTQAEPFRLGLVSVRPIPPSYVSYARSVLDGTADLNLAELTWNDLFCLIITGTSADVDVWRDQLLTPAMGLGLQAGLMTGRLATEGPSLIVTDVDSTFITDEVIELLARRAGTEAEVAEVTSRAMAGELDFTESLHARVATLAGLPTTIFDDVLGDIQLSAGAADLVRWQRDSGGTFGLVSGGFTHILDPIAQTHSIDHWVANTLEVDAGHLTGRVIGEVIDRAAKERHVRAWATDLSTTICVGDGANDLDMLHAAGLGMAYCAKPIVLEQADAAITIPRLDIIAGFFADL